MIDTLKSIHKDQYWDYFILVARFLLGWTFLRYGYGKLTDGQFGITEAEMVTQVKDLSLFRLSWYLFDHQPFKAFIGISQVICGLLLVVNRTAIIGALLFLPIVTTILLIDLTFMPSNFAGAFAWRLSFYIILDLLVLWHYKEKIITIWNAVRNNINTKYNIPVWGYLVLPVMAIGLEIAGMLPKLLISLITHPDEAHKSFGKVSGLIKEVINHIGS